MKYSLVTCGECQRQAYMIFVNWPPTFYWCRYCHRVFAFEKVENEDSVTWQLRGYPDS